MSPYMDLDFQDSMMKEQHFWCTFHMLERKCSVGIEKLKVIIGEHLQNGIPASDLLEKTVSFFTLKKALLLHNGYSKCSREILRLFPTSEEDVASLCL